MKVVINTCYGGFGLSESALARYKELAGKPFNEYDYHDKNRADPFLIQTIEDLGTNESSGDCAALRIVDIPNDVNWEIGEYDGMEWVAEVHRTWC